MIEPKVVSLNDLVLDTGSLLRRLIGEDIELVILPSAALSNVKVDPSQIEQGLMNLAINARDAMPSGGRLVVETADIDLSESYAAKNADASSGEHVVVAVRDTGVGMTAEIRSRVFEPFFTTKEVGKGTGLGLSMCYGIVAQSGGHMTVESEPGEGATFRIFLPRATEDVEAPSAGDSSPPLPLGSETVLLVEDEPAIRRVEAHLLGDHGYRVLEAANGVDALRLVQESHDGEIHLLVADVVMPLMGGRELAQELIQIHPETKVLHTSGYAGDVTENHGTPISGADFLQKPFTPDVFVRKVREILDSRN
jgi:CheY-like chemotaxis protein